MGMYTEFVFGAGIKRELTWTELTALKWIGGDPTVTWERAAHAGDLLNHPFFRTERWRMIGHCSSYYFGYSDSHTKIHFDDISHEWLLSFRCSLKNYDNEIEKFIDWIRPLVEDGSGDMNFLGYSMYEECFEPVLYYLKEEDR